MPDSATIKVNVFDGRRRLVKPDLSVLITINDARLKQHFRDDVKGSSFTFEVPFNNNNFDDYTVIAHAKGHFQAGFHPVHVSPDVPQVVDLMLLPKKSKFDFGEASWPKLSDAHPRLIEIFSKGVTATEARRRYTDLLENQPGALACIFNVIFAMRGINLPEGTPLDYMRGFRWDAKSIKQDRFFAFFDAELLNQVQRAVTQGTFEPEPGFQIFHKGATSSYKEVQFGEGNVQFSFHGDDAVPDEFEGCTVVESDIDYFKDPLAHGLLEVIPNHFAGPTDPKTAYVLRWIASRHAGVPSFEPPYRIV